MTAVLQKRSRVPIFFSGMFFILILSGCLKTPPPSPLHSGLQSAQLPPLLPVTAFFENGQSRSLYRISPDGKRLAWIETVRGVRTVHFKTLGEDRVDHIALLHGDIPYFRWAQDSRRVLVQQRSGGRENSVIYSYDLNAPAQAPFKVVDFKGFLTDKKRALLHKTITNDPDHILVEHNDRDLSCYDLYRYNIRTGENEQIAENPGDVRTWITDASGNLLARIRSHETSGDKIVEKRGPGESSWRKVIDLDFEDVFQVIGLDAETGRLWALSNRGRDKTGLVEFFLETGEENLVYEDKKVNIEDCRLFWETQKPFLVYLQPDYPRVRFLDPGMEKEFEPVFKKLSEEHFRAFSITSVDDRTQVFVIYAYSDKDWAYYLFDRGSGRIEPLSRNPQPEYQPYFSDIRPIAFTSRDGLEINGYLTLPKGASAGKLPLVLWVHGGPWSRDYWGFNKEVQFLANRGYAVLQINFRGSSGYGRAFMEAAVGEFGGKMQADLIDGAKWAVQEGIADPDKIAVCGSSYGGYAALAGLAFTPDFFACGIDAFGPSDLEALIEHAPVWWKLGLPRWYRYVGNPKNPADRAAMRARSPIYKAAVIQKPLLVIYGSEDQRVDQKHSRNMIDKLTELGKEVEWYSFPDDGHGISAQNRVTYYRLIQTFLARHLGGRDFL